MIYPIIFFLIGGFIYGSADASIPKKQVSMLQTKLKNHLLQRDKKSKGRLITIVIDPGHGGKDPGATGQYHSREKDIVLLIAHRLKALINRHNGFKAILTRQDDHFISLRQRLVIARQAKADLFLAIHADAFNRKQAMGASVFALSLHGASSEAAQWLSDQENNKELAGVKLTKKNKNLRSVLLSLSQISSIATSLETGKLIINQLKHIGSLHHDSVEQAPFVVLKNPDIPSLLIETGFLSNPNEELKLRSPMYQTRIANAIATGIIAYFKGNPPYGTLLASM